jgi:hypothetical protein
VINCQKNTVPIHGDLSYQLSTFDVCILNERPLHNPFKKQKRFNAEREGFAHLLIEKADLAAGIPPVLLKNGR